MCTTPANVRAFFRVVGRTHLDTAPVPVVAGAAVVQKQCALTLTVYTYAAKPGTVSEYVHEP